ncbi:hypothetical protein LOD99_12508 [Oopsacas minuta]|uniref:Uncharacterized protein n=1 Tax=Oopsacas minuta TaxID=111878 RepID=A0AAV7JCI3_9METZ|nr:hypothetical protein LOD99_12508 [Oopsacas minuta]
MEPSQNVFEVGLTVLKKDFRRKKRAGGELDPNWLGPYTIVKALGRGLYYSLQEIVEPRKSLLRIVFSSNMQASTQKLFPSVHEYPPNVIPEEPCAVVQHTALLLVRFQPYLKVSIVASSEDSDLEAFSHNPADGSFAPVAGQPSANTKCLNQLFLSY